jgi:hypothetical protein
MEKLIAQFVACEELIARLEKDNEPLLADVYRNSLRKLERDINYYEDKKIWDQI